MDTAAPHPAADRAAAERGGEVRELMLGWCLWLLGAWAVTLFLDAPVPAARWMILLAAIGLMLAWPALRLSQRNGRGGTLRITLLDWASLMIILQAVIWPLRLASGLGDPLWTVGQALWLAAAMGAWSLLTGAIIAAGRWTTSGLGRTLAMTLCVLLLVGEPLVMVLAARNGGWAFWVSPVGVLWELMGPRYGLDYPAIQARTVAAGFAAVAAWAALGAVRLFPRHRADADRPHTDHDQTRQTS